VLGQTQASGFLAKPFELSELLALVAKATNGRRAG